MGQYYKPYIRGKDGSAKSFNPQNAIYRTVRGLSAGDEASFRSEGYHDHFSGMKLMEHSWLANDFVNGVLEAVWGNPCAMAWVGDYADEHADFKGAYTTGVYNAVWGNEGLPEGAFDQMPTTHREGFVVNRSKGVYIDLAEYEKAATYSPRWDREHKWCIHPLPLLTAIGNGRGGGDYHGDCMGMVGRWAMDFIEFTEERPEGMREIDYGVIAFREED